MAAWKLEQMKWSGPADGPMRRRDLRHERPRPPGWIRWVPTVRRGEEAGFPNLLPLALGETLWATRCVACDAPGEVLCGRCRMLLPYIDRCRACPRCGSPNGVWACTDCNSFTLRDLNRRRPPFERCVSVIEHRGPARNIVTEYKDAGERRLAGEIARLMEPSIPRSWREEGLVLAFIPADHRARRRRGFDHMELVAEELSRRTRLPCRRLLEKDAGEDQRGLSRHERLENMARRLHAVEGQVRGRGVIVLDDVYTTGATLFAACDALRGVGWRHIRCLTLARTP